MDTLPDEILLLILPYLLRPTIPCIRLVSRRYASLGLHFLLTKSHFCLRGNSISRLQHIADHPVLCRTLQEVIFFVDIAPNFASIEDWRQQAHGICLSREKSDNDAIAQEWLTLYRPFEVVPMIKIDMPRLFLNAGWNQHQAMLREQEDLSKSAKTYLDLRKALRKLVNLRSIKIDSYEAHRPDLMRQLYTSQQHQAWYCWNMVHSRAGDEYNAAQLSATALATSFYDVNAGSSNMSTLGSLTSTFRVLNIRSIGFSQFKNAYENIVIGKSVGTSYQSSIKTVSLRNNYLETEHFLQEPVPAFTGNDTIAAIDESRAIAASFSIFLSSIANLESLNLAVSESPLYSLRSEDVFTKQSWQDLSELRISYIDIHQISFQDFLQRHASKLKTLKIASADLRNHSAEKCWSRMLQFIGTKLQLRIFELDGFLTENYEIVLGIDSCWAAPDGTRLHAGLIAQYLLVGTLNMTSNDKSVLEKIGQHLSWHDFEVTVYHG